MRSYSFGITDNLGERHVGCYDTSMLNAVVRIVGENWQSFDITEESPTKWIIRDEMRPDILWILEESEIKIKQLRKSLPTLKL